EPGSPGRHLPTYRGSTSASTSSSPTGAARSRAFTNDTAATIHPVKITQGEAPIQDNHPPDDWPPKRLFVVFLSFLSIRFSLSDRSGSFLALGFRGDLSGMGPP
ncbi:MAG: hypothetical protein LC792_14180, partial [Actinobacteria bacterium]|nr:hypothetical protein [Actinomycetota bacterium]